MTHYKKVMLGMILLLPWLVWCSVEHKPDWVTRFNAWCCKKLGYGCSSSKSSDTRSNGGPRPKGGVLMALNVDTRAVSTLWTNCDCWSPVPAQQGSVAVATSTGIWIVPVDKPEKRQLVFHATDVLELVGTELASDGGMLFLRSSNNPECDFEPWKATPDYSSASRADLDSDLACGANFNFQNLTKPAQTSGAGTVATVLYRGRYEIDLRTAGSIKPLFPGANDMERFDPVWLSQNSIVFVTRP